MYIDNHYDYFLGIYKKYIFDAMFIMSFIFTR